MEALVRDFIEADRGTLRELFVASRDAAFFWVPRGAHRLEDFDASTQGERILVATGDSSPIGFASIWEADSFLHNLFVHPNLQGLGVGRLLLASCGRYFSSVPTLKCLKANEHAWKFYASQGWSVRSEKEGPEGAYLVMERA